MIRMPGCISVQIVCINSVCCFYLWNKVRGYFTTTNRVLIKTGEGIEKQDVTNLQEFETQQQLTKVQRRKEKVRRKRCKAVKLRGQKSNMNLVLVRIRNCP